MVVNVSNPPFNHETGGWHVVSIADYDATTREVTLDNQWGSGNDIRIKLDDLYALSTTRESRALADVTADNPNASDHLKELKALELLMRRGKTIKPSDLNTALQHATSAWKLAPDEAIDSSPERREYLATLENIFNSFDFKTRFDFLKQMSLAKRDTSYKSQALEHLFAATAHEVGFNHKSLKQPGPQKQEFGRAIIGIWSDLPEARQQRILAAMAAKHS